MPGIDTRAHYFEYEPAGERKGAVVIIHGLNVRPETFEALAKALNDAGFAVIVPRLTGHRGRWREDWRAPSAEIWKRETEEALIQARDRYGRISIIGYSMGGLLAMALLEKGWAAHVDKFIFLAPAFSIKAWVTMWRWLPWCLPFWLPIPSFIPDPYCSARLTSPGWYRALLELYAVVSGRKGRDALGGIKTLILIDPCDELISHEGLVRWAKEQDLPQCEIREVRRTIRERRGFPAHLLYDPTVFSEEGWRRFIEEIEAFFRQ